MIRVRVRVNLGCRGRARGRVIFKDRVIIIGIKVVGVLVYS